MKTPPPDRKISLPPCHRTVIATLLIVFSFDPSSLLAQSIVPDSTLPGGVMSTLNTNDSRVDITGGLATGSNLFHSFSDFQVSNGSTANFLSQGAENILSRVTGSNPSNISGTIGVDIGQVNRSNANLFFLNPNGVVFGSTASLDLNGSFHVSTADSIRLGTEPGAGLFSASDPLADILTSAPPSAFGFSNSNPLASISVSGANLRVQPSKVISIIGGDADGLAQADASENLVADPQPGVHITSSTISASGGQINLVSVAAPGTVTTEGPGLTPNFQATAFNQLGTVDITNGSIIDVRENNGGTVVIRGGRLSLDNLAQINASTSGTSNAGTVTINVSENVVVAGTGLETSSQSAIFAKTTGLAEGSGSGGNIAVTAQNIEVKDGGQISTSTEGRGNAGTIQLTTTGGEVTLRGGDNRTDSLTPTREATFGSGLFSSTMGLGNAGSVSVDSGNVNISNGASISVQTIGRGNGDAGTVTIQGTQGKERADKVSLFGLHANGNSTAAIFAGASELGNAPGLLGSGGTITIKSETLELKDGAKIAVRSTGLDQMNAESLLGPNEPLPKAGTVEITTGNLLITGANTTGSAFVIDPSEISAGVTGPASTGTIMVNAENITLSNGGLISAETQTTMTNTAENRGSISVTALEKLDISGAAERTDFNNLNNFNPQENNINDNLAISLSGIRSRTSGVNQAGDIKVTAKNLDVFGGAQITSSVLSSGTGKGGNLTVTVEDTLQISGAYKFLSKAGPMESEISNSTRGSGEGGTVSIFAKNVDLIEGGLIETSSIGRGSGDAGDVSITVKENVTLTGTKILMNEPSDITSKTDVISSQIFTGASDRSSETKQKLLRGNGGNITVKAKMVRVEDGATIRSNSVGITKAAPEETLEETRAALQETIINLPESQRPRAGNLTIDAESIMVTGARTIGGDNTFSIFPSEIGTGVSGPAGTGNLNLTANNITIRDGANVSSESERTLPLGVQRGGIDITAYETLEISGVAIRTDFPENPQGNDPRPKNSATGLTVRPSSLLARTSGTNQGGDIKISAKNFAITNGARLTNDSLATELKNAGSAGKILIAADNATISGVAPVLNNEGNALLSIISSETEGPGDAGQIEITAKTIDLLNGGRISASSVPREEAVGTGVGGTIQLLASDSVHINGAGVELGTGAIFPSGLFSITEGSAEGGTISISSPSIIEINNGATISTSATGLGVAGEISLKAKNEILLDGATLSTKATQSSGGNIKLDASDLIFVKDSLIESSVEGDETTEGGNISLDPDFIVLLNSQIFAKAADGAGGNITLVSDVIFQDTRNDINASVRKVCPSFL